ncbi:MAG: ribose 5-phosphate isomerase B [Eubacteriales bacterium]|jgi:ribose 5-phosphate isomerase B|nr:ribose 5-phosphate isomerase B [Eubacteriales bacterium]MDD3289806.1 ribose 5-phosphate isomerase B [Eubacteriales bacterium]MDD3864440.1 ribose 5-phosphate isomerase B [Eubacteriales bacterium]
MKIALASDHGGFTLKEEIEKHLIERGFEVLDLGTHSEESVDYPVYGKCIGEAVMAGEADCGVAFCGTGVGISIACNKVKGIRCAVATNCFMAEMAKKHNDANILALGGRILAPAEAVEILDRWLDSTFEGDRHARRVRLLDEM